MSNKRRASSSLFSDSFARDILASGIVGREWSWVEFFQITDRRWSHYWEDDETSAELLLVAIE